MKTVPARIATPVDESAFGSAERLHGDLDLSVADTLARPSTGVDAYLCFRLCWAYPDGQ